MLAKGQDIGEDTSPIDFSYAASSTTLARGRSLKEYSTVDAG
jgi:hypothetical protein